MFVRRPSLEQGKQRCHVIKRAADNNGARDSAHNESEKGTCKGSGMHLRGRQFPYARLAISIFLSWPFPIEQPSANDSLSYYYPTLLR